MISAGEASGDAHAADALAAFRRSIAHDGTASTDAPALDTFGMGGARLAAAGCELIVDNRDLSVIGFVDVLLNYHRFLARLATLRKALRERRPSLLLIVDYPDFNLKLADTARELGIPVLMYVAPQVWAWRAGRIPDIVRRVDHLAVLFPFEERLWREAGAEATCVGHPMVHDIERCTDRDEARARLHTDLPALTTARTGVDDAGELIALLPGSRPGEIRRLLPLLVETAARLREQRPACRFVLPRASSIAADALETALEAAREALPDGLPPADIAILDPSIAAAPVAVAAADLALVASGTATLETGLIGTPMLVVYRVAAANYWLMRRLIRIPDIALVNIVAEERVVPEFVQDQATPAALAEAALALLDEPAGLAAMRESLSVIERRLGSRDASEGVARLMRSMLEPNAE